MDPYKPSLLIYTDGPVADPSPLTRLQEHFRIALYFHAPHLTMQADLDGVLQGLTALSERYQIPLVVEELAGSDWVDHATVQHEPVTTAEAESAFPVIDHLAAYAQTEGYDFFMSLADFSPMTDTDRAIKYFRDAADRYGVRFYDYEEESV